MLPNEWGYKKLGVVAELQRGFDLPSAKRLEGTVPIISSGGLSGYHNEAKVKAPGIVTGRYGSIGDVFFVQDDFWPLNTSLWVKNFHGNEPKFIYYLLTSFDFKKFSDKTGVPGVNRNDLHAVKVGVPPLPEQRKIAKILTTWDKAIATTEKLIETSKQQKKALMQQLLTGKKRLLNPDTGNAFEDEWESSILSKVCKITKGKQLNRSTLKATGKYPVINGGITPSGYTDSFNTERNTITISEGGNSCGYTDFQKVDFWCGGHCYNLTNVTVDAEYLYQYLKFSERRIMSLRVGSGLPNIQKKAIESVSVLYPSEVEQQKIASVLNAADKEIEVLGAKFAHLKQEKKALMQQLLTGKRRVKVAETEST
ncbi:restriction endonuclease subunit S [Vibrio cyclitrophicus]